MNFILIWFKKKKTILRARFSLGPNTMPNPNPNQTPNYNPNLNPYCIPPLEAIDFARELQSDMSRDLGGVVSSRSHVPLPSSFLSCSLSSHIYSCFSSFEWGLMKSAHCAPCCTPSSRDILIPVICPNYKYCYWLNSIWFDEHWHI